MKRTLNAFSKSLIFSLISIIIVLVLAVSNTQFASSSSTPYSQTTVFHLDTSTVLASQIPGLVVYYPFDGNTQDISGMWYHGVNNRATFISGVSGQALHFNGKDSYVSTPININPSVMPRMTMIAWVRAESDSPTRQIISHDNGNYDRSMGIDYRGGGTGWSCFSGSGSVLGYHKVTLGEWVFIAAVFDQAAAKVRLYVNDSVYEENGTLGSGWEYINIGRNPSFGEYFAGDIDDVRIYSSALGKDEIDALRANPGVVPDVTLQVTPTPTPATPAIATESTTTPPPLLIPTLPSTPTPSSPVVRSVTSVGDIIFESRSKPSGSVIQIPLLLKGSKEKIGNMDITLEYDPLLLEANEVIRGSLTSNSLFNYNVVTPGTLKISLADKVGFEGDGSIAYLACSVIGQAGASCALKISSVVANRASDSASVLLSIQNGTFKVLGNEQLKGDFNGDGRLTPVDALAALQMAVGKRAEEAVMDVNNDNKVTSLDASQILKEAVSRAPVPAQSSEAEVMLRALSPDQGRIVDMFGWPHSFSLLGIEDEEGKLHRSEYWTYYDGQTTYIFLDGVFQAWEPVDALPEGSWATPYRPHEFIVGSSVREVKKAIASGDEWLRLPEADFLFEGILDEAEMYAAPQLMAGFYRGKLVFLEALALAPDGGE